MVSVSIFKASVVKLDVVKLLSCWGPLLRGYCCYCEKRESSFKILLFLLRFQKTPKIPAIFPRQKVHNFFLFLWRKLSSFLIRELNYNLNVNHFARNFRWKNFRYLERKLSLTFSPSWIFNDLKIQQCLCLFFLNQTLNMKNCSNVPESFRDNNWKNCSNVPVSFRASYKLISKFSPLKVIPLKLFYYQTFFETWRNKHSWYEH